MSNYFHPSHSPFPSSNPLGLSRTRFYSNSSGSSQIANNLAVLYSLMGVNFAVFGYVLLSLYDVT